MKHMDFKNKLREMIVEEMNNMLNETSYKYGGLLDPKDFDPIDPEVHIVGFGSMSRSQLRDGITSRIEAMSKTAADAASSNDAYRKYKSLLALVQEKSVIQQMIRAEIEVAEQMEAMRTKGGRRSTPIPKQL
jgi:hypothetical protein